jgi:hypothetical protein
LECRWIKPTAYARVWPDGAVEVADDPLLWAAEEGL